MKPMLAAPVLTLALSLCLCAAADNPKQAPQPAPQPPKGEFDGKVLAVSTKNPNAPGGLMEKVQVRPLAGRPFLVGIAADERLPRGATIWIPLEDVIQIVEFKSLEEARQAFRGGSP